MDSKLLSCILNPVRMRIIQALVKNKNMTVQQIAQELPEVPQATLYRHLSKLVEVKAITVVKENKVRGALEKVYALETNPYTAVTNALENSDKEEYINLFYNFLMTLLGDFEKYIHQQNTDLQKDGVTFRSAALYLSDDEFQDFIQDLVKAFDKVRDNKPSSERKLRKISTIIVPSVED
ncbi:transcriptional regulator, ArsR family [Clostridiales bacterium oral taxon 876 str. F0540]|nr:transcriptional regulator, ArsR family [Clostridiales bacterium oral taxon 876 str. F0540]